MAAALLLATAGVFAGKSKFTYSYTLVYLSRTTYVPIVEAASGSVVLQEPFTTNPIGGTQVKISGFPILLYYQGSTPAAVPLYFL